MKLWNIVKTVGTGLISAAVPGAGLLIGAVNEFLPDDKKLPSTATGTDLSNAVESLPAEQRASLMEKEFDVEITEIKESHSTVRTMLESDAANPHTTRPKIAYQAFQVVGTTTIITISLWAYAVATSNDKMVKTVMDGWPFVLGVVAPLVILLHAYFGVLKQEHKNRLDAAGGMPTDPSANQSAIMGKIAKLLNRS